jgi:glutathione S-transferase
MSTVRIHGHRISTFTRTACMTCIEKGIDYELVPIADVRGSGHGALHPFRRMPIAEIDGALIIETLAITGHLDEAFPGPRLQPEGHAERALMRTWIGVCGGYLFPDLVLGLPRKRPATVEELAAARLSLERAQGLMGGGGPFLVGETLTLADLYLAPQLANGTEKVPQVLEGLDALGAWLALMQERESFRRTDPSRRG